MQLSGVSQQNPLLGLLLQLPPFTSPSIHSQVCWKISRHVFSPFPAFPVILLSTKSRSCPTLPWNCTYDLLAVKPNQTLLSTCAVAFTVQQHTDFQRCNWYISPSKNYSVSKLPFPWEEIQSNHYLGFPTQVLGHTSFKRLLESTGHADHKIPERHASRPAHTLPLRTKGSPAFVLSWAQRVLSRLENVVPPS